MKARFTGIWGIYFLVAILVSLLSIGGSIAVGSTSIPLTDVYKIISNHLMISDFQGNWSKADDSIVWQIRAPRVALAFLVGASLALAGTAFQGMLRNPLADPYTLGVSSGASLGAVIAITFQFSLGFLGIYNLTFFALAGSLLALFLVYRLSYLGNRIMIETLILSGIIISSFLGSIISLLISLSGDELRQIIFWLMGSVAMRDWGHVLMLLPILLISFLLLLWKSRELNIMAFGDETAQYIGVDVEKSKKWILFISSLLTAAAVSVSGTIGFVGLVVPHLVRIIIGPNHMHLIPFSLFGGGIFLVIADTLARTIISPSELPLGVITALIGAPVFAVILVRRHLERER